MLYYDQSTLSTGTPKSPYIPYPWDSKVDLSHHSGLQTFFRHTAVGTLLDAFAPIGPEGRWLTAPGGGEVGGMGRPHCQMTLMPKHHFHMIKCPFSPLAGIILTAHTVFLIILTPGVTSLLRHM